MLGALISKEHMVKVKGYIDLARSEGCSILCGDGVEELSLPDHNKNVSVMKRQSEKMAIIYSGEIFTFLMHIHQFTYHPTPLSLSSSLCLSPSVSLPLFPSPSPPLQGYFLRPTVITGVSDDSRLMKEEVFGPVTCVVPFKTEEEVYCRCR